MENFDIKYEILDYDKFYKRLEETCNDKTNKYEITKQEPIGYTKCGFPIEHYKIGNGPKHIVYMGGAHGNEIISVDYVTQLMQNIAQGNGEFAQFNEEEFTIDFIPCQNPEGFFTTTYALKSIMGTMSEEEVEKFSKQYWSFYREDDQNVLKINAILSAFCEEFGLEAIKKELPFLFWKQSANKEISMNYIIAFLENLFPKNHEEISVYIQEKWLEHFQGKTAIPKEKKHHKIFESVSLDCIPEKDEAHRNLKAALTKLYQTGKFPIGTLANFFANASGVNLNDNNEYYFRELQQKIAKQGEVYASLRDNNLLKSVPGPVGVASENMEGDFEYTEENKALLSFLEKQERENYAFINCHGTGGVLYLYPVADNDMEKAHEEGVTRNFNFFVNGRIATEYTKKQKKFTKWKLDKKGMDTEQWDILIESQASVIICEKNTWLPFC